jgi:hypothetical protein
MKIRVPAVSLIVAGLLLCTAIPAVAQEGEMTMDSAMAAMMAKWQEFKTPGKPHEGFKELVGTWSAKSMFWMTPDAPPSTSEGTAEFKTILGGRYLVQDFAGSYEGETFHGMGITAYNNFQKRYTDIWIDDMGTGVFISHGNFDESGKVLIMKGTVDDPMMGRADVPVRNVMTHVDENTYKMEMYTVDPTGREFKSMEVVYTREK